MVERTYPDLWHAGERRRLVRLCTALTGDRDAAEDLAQEALLEAWRSRHKLHDPAGADRWLSAIARNVCLRWARRRGRELALVEMAAAEPVALEVELERSELEELLDRALSLLPPETRDVLVHHYVHDSPQAEIAARLGITEAAVSMRVSRGKVVLRRLLATGDNEPGDGWVDTRVWCSSCGARKLQIQRRPDAVLFRCAGRARTPSMVFDLANPFFAELVGDLIRPTAILKRAAEWSTSYFAGGTGDVACTRCGHLTRLSQHDDGRRRGLHGTCGSCGQEVWTSVHGVVQSLPAARALRGAHGRVRTLPTREIGYECVDATLVRVEAASASEAVDVVLARDTLRVLATH